MSKETNYETIITMAGKEVAVGKELKYFWNNKNKVVTKHRNNIKRTLIELHLKKRLSDKVATDEGDYQVRDYSIPNIAWIKQFVGYSHRVYLTSVGSVDEIYLDVTTRDAYNEEKVEAVDSTFDESQFTTLVEDASQGKVLSPDAWKAALRQITQYNTEWEPKSEITKNEINFADLHGFFTTEGKYYVLNREGDRTYSQMLGLTFDDFKKYGSETKPLDIDALVRAMTAKSAE